MTPYSPTHTLVNTGLFYLWVCFFCILFTSLLYFLDSTYKQYHTVFVFLCLTCFTQHNTLQRMYLVEVNLCIPPGISLSSRMLNRVCNWLGHWTLTLIHLIPLQCLNSFSSLSLTSPDCTPQLFKFPECLLIKGKWGILHLAFKTAHNQIILSVLFTLSLQ